MNLQVVTAAVGETGLAVVGAFHPGAEDGAPEGIGTLVLLGPADGAMWAAFRAGPEAADGAPHPLDRWSRRVIGALAERLGAVALYPFGGPPWHPFQHWAARGEGAWPSPVAMQVTATRGLWASYRGALGFPGGLVLSERAFADPCLGCPAPCLTACPVGAFAGGAYDVAGCVRHVSGEGGSDCRGGCLVRASCPAGTTVGLPDAQRAFHMAAFLRAQTSGAG